MKNIWIIAVAALSAAAVLMGCTGTEQPGTTTSSKVSLTAGQEFVNGQATLTVSLSAAAATDVTVTLEQSGTLPAANLTWNPVVRIAAGAKEARVDVTAKADNLEAGEYTAIFAIKAATGAELGSPAEVTVKYTVAGSDTPGPGPEPTAAEVNITAFDDAFVDNKAHLTLTLSAAKEADVKVTLEVGTEVSDGTVIPVDALTFDNPVTIAAGATSAVVEITVDPDQLASGSNWAVLSIKEADNNVTVGKRATAYIEAELELKARFREDWTAEYEGNETYQGYDYAVVTVTGTGDSWYECFILEESKVHFETAEELVVSTAQNMYDMWASYNGQYDKSEFAYTQEGGVYVYPAVTDPGNYYIFVVGLTKDLEPTYDYTIANFQIAEDEQATPEYERYIGTWDYYAPNMTDGADSLWFSVDIAKKYNNSSYTITGFGGLKLPETLALEGNFDETTGGFELRYQDFGDKWRLGDGGELYQIEFMGPVYIEYSTYKGYYLLDFSTSAVMSTYLFDDETGDVNVSAGIINVNFGGGNIVPCEVGWSGYFYTQSYDASGNAVTNQRSYLLHNAPSFPAKLKKSAAAPASAPAIRSIRHNAVEGMRMMRKAQMSPAMDTPRQRVSR